MHYKKVLSSYSAEAVHEPTQSRTQQNNLIPLLHSFFPFHTSAVKTLVSLHLFILLHLLGLAYQHWPSAISHCWNHTHPMKFWLWWPCSILGVFCDGKWHAILVKMPITKTSLLWTDDTKRKGWKKLLAGLQYKSARQFFSVSFSLWPVEFIYSLQVEGHMHLLACCQRKHCGINGVLQRVGANREKRGKRTFFPFLAPLHKAQTIPGLALTECKRLSRSSTWGARLLKWGGELSQNRGEGVHNRWQNC